MLMTGLSAGVAFAAVKPSAKDYETPVAYLWEDEEYPDTPYTLVTTKKGAVKYALDENGKKVTGWVYSYGTRQPYNPESDYDPIYKIWYYFGEDYKPLKGFQTIGKCKYYFKDNGVMAQNEAVKVGKRLLWFGKNGALLKNKAGFKRVLTGYGDGAFPLFSTYYVNKIGVVLTGWRKLDGKWYHFSEANGVMATAPRKINGTVYCFNEQGKWIKNARGWKHYTYKGDGEFIWYYFVNGKGYTGWKKSKGKWYYLDEQGKMVTDSSVTLKGVTYHFDGNGVCLNP